ncbi:hypothetical protein SARC_07280 [Sphaeroforma arctica JP610]|uniref:Uncharacterized protein n=1 Tax=Sphaeroforma arctica JP610 TaxID=667725 RepID=A0A0L0FU55_9EUKA|nr:hypothetical protein SARC_07280 [Sphaeroforma arctica JP610]KNC80362.1 hypothetical protein SARC_07280 [Sphaeroforma arctica JP610]|eukprot:XP_014154264.1 hypothetical protein SARC_07280 [Sphaeroforma arctica JP610]
MSTSQLLSFVRTNPGVYPVKEMVIVISTVFLNEYLDCDAMEDRCIQTDSLSQYQGEETEQVPLIAWLLEFLGYEPSFKTIPDLEVKRNLERFLLDNDIKEIPVAMTLLYTLQKNPD